MCHPEAWARGHEVITGNSTPQLRESTGRDWVVTAALLATFVSALGIGVAFQAEWATVVVAVTGLAALVWWHSPTFGLPRPELRRRVHRRAAGGPRQSLGAQARRPAKQLKSPACGQGAPMAIRVRRRA